MYGRIFDRASFFVMRIVVNTGFGLSIVGFLLGRGKVGLVLASVLFGIALSGGDILWQLWATRLAPDDRVADCMALHTFFTGLRGVIAPFLAFWALEHSSSRVIAGLSAAMIAVATVLLVPDARRDLRSHLP